jgi:hypothetical protein
MKPRWKIILIVAGLLVLCALVIFSAGHRARSTVEKTRRLLRRQGFKTNLAEFNLATSSELRARAAILTNAGALCYADRSLRQTPRLQVPIFTNSALVIWKQETLELDYTKSGWPEVRTNLNLHRFMLDSACQAALAGPIQFEPEGPGMNFRLPYLAWLESLGQVLALRTVLELHDANPAGAWTNLLALTRLVTAWNPEPFEVAHFMRFSCADNAASATWQALQTNAWTDAQLATLQHEWESVDYFSSLPQTAALSRASMAALCEHEHALPFRTGLSFQQLASETLHSPRDAWFELTSTLWALNYHRAGLYGDENSVLLYFRDRELDLQRAIKSPTWSEMRAHRGTTNLIHFQTKQQGTQIAVLLNAKQLGIGFMSMGLSLPGGASVAEARRRLLITALVLERYHLSHGTYPESLDLLPPALLQKPLPDFIDGQPLRYRRTQDQHFLLYSIGLDCVDNHGRQPAIGNIFTGPRLGRQPDTDLVWPRRPTAGETEEASSAEIEAGQQSESAAWEEMRKQYQNPPAKTVKPSGPLALNVTGFGRPDQKQPGRLSLNPNARRTNGETVVSA